MQDEHVSNRIAGITAILAAVAWVCWAIINGLTRGGLDIGPPTVSPRLFNLGQLLMVCWNLLLIPTALLLWSWLQHKSPKLILLYTTCGITSLLFWAYGGATHGITPVLEVSYIMLSGVWWLGVGQNLRKERSALGTFTMILGIFALLDGVLTFLEPMPFYIYAIAGPKLPLSIIWDFWIGVVFLAKASVQKRAA